MPTPTLLETAAVEVSAAADSSDPCDLIGARGSHTLRNSSFLIYTSSVFDAQFLVFAVKFLVFETTFPVLMHDFSGLLTSRLKLAPITVITCDTMRKTRVVGWVVSDRHNVK